MNQLPQSWMRDPDFWLKPVEFVTSPQKMVILHGCMVLGLEHPWINKDNKSLICEMLDNLEAAFEDMGLEEPPTGWRSWTTKPPADDTP